MQGPGPRYDEAIQIYEAIGDRAGLINVHEALVFILYHAGEYAEARAVQERDLVAFRKTGEPLRIASALSLLSIVNLKDGAYPAARRGHRRGDCLVPKHGRYAAGRQPAHHRGRRCHGGRGPDTGRSPQRCIRRAEGADG